MNEMINQPIINIGMIGHVSNGKSSIVKSITSIATQRHSDEKQKNITIKLGYANAKIYKCTECEPPECFQPGPSKEFKKQCSICDNDMELVTHVSFVDCPGHIQFMATMLNGSCIMDTTILVEAINNSELPAPQTLNHLNAITIGNIPNSVVCLNKFDLIKKETALKKIETLKEAFSDTILKDSPMIPLSATFNINIDVLCDYISQIKPIKRDLESPCRMIIVRSFNVNKPGISIKDLQGGIIGGSILRGKLAVGDEIELRPGHYMQVDKTKTKTKTKAKWNFKPLKGKVLSINSESNKLNSAIPGGLIGVQLDIDPALTTNDGLIGQILTPPGKNYDVYEKIAIEYKLLDKNYKVKKGDILMLNINACNISSTIIKIYKSEKVFKLRLEKPIPVEMGDSVVICHDEHIFGTGKILEGVMSNELID